MEVELIKNIQQGSTLFFDTFFKCVTFMGDKLFFVVVFCLLYWCYNKRFAFNFAIGCGVAAVSNSLLKVAFNRPRPYMADSNVVDYVHASGGSFPSGHSTLSAATSALLLCEVYTKKTSIKKYLKIILTAALVVVSLLVGFSRMYLGQHYLSDVIMGLVCGAIVGIIWHKFCFIKNDREHIYALWLLPVLFGCLFIFVTEMFTSDMQHQDVYFLLGIAMAIIVGYYLEKRYIKLDLSINPAWFVIFKAVFGLGTTIGLYFLLNLLPSILILECVKGIILGIWASLVLMIIYKAISKRLLNTKTVEDKNANIK